jgi:hypothetical protein
MIKFFLTMPLLAFLVSCDEPSGQKSVEVNQFYAKNLTNETYYTVTADLLAEGRKCVIWAEKSSGITREKAEEIADKYDTIIHPRIVGAFGMKNITVQGYHFDNILDYANWLAGKNNKKLTVLLLDIKDNYKNGDNNTYVGGYFDSVNFYQSGNSNGCDMIYLDTYPGLIVSPLQTYVTFAHELQHLINYATTIAKNRQKLDTWIDEGLSSQAEHILIDGYVYERCVWFINDERKTISKGNNFFVWGNHPEEPMAILDDYATVYLFFRWLYLQANSGLKSSIFLDIETSNLSDISIITNVASKIRSEWADWDTLLRSWLAANYYPANTDYGYKDDYLKNIIKVKPIETADSKISLYPGEGVYSSIKDPFQIPSPSGNIRYKELSNSTSKALLTYNANTNNSKSTAPETGSLASVSLSPGSRMSINSIQTEKTHTGPYIIDAGDFTGRFGRNK